MAPKTLSKHEAPLLLLLWLVLVLQGTPTARGFAVSTQLQGRSRTDLYLTMPKRRSLVHQGNENILKKTRLESATAFEKSANGRFELMKQHKVVARTAMVVALIAAATRHVVWQRLRRSMLAGTVIFGVGDLGAQLLTHYNKSSNRSQRFVLDANRFVISSILGSLWAGIVNPTVYGAVESILPGASDIRSVLIKMAITCSILSTAGNYTTMMFRRFLKQSVEKPRYLKENFRSCLTSCNNDFLEVLQDDLKIWPLYDILCYSLIPPGVRPITNAFMASAWSMYMSIASAKTTTTVTTGTKGNDRKAESGREEEKHQAEQVGEEGKSLVHTAAMATGGV